MESGVASAQDAVGRRGPERGERDDDEMDTKVQADPCTLAGVLLASPVVQLSGLSLKCKRDGIVEQGGNCVCLHAVCIRSQRYLRFPCARIDQGALPSLVQTTWVAQSCRWRSC